MEENSVKIKMDDWVDLVSSVEKLREKIIKIEEELLGEDGIREKINELLLNKKYNNGILYNRKQTKEIIYKSVAYLLNLLFGSGILWFFLRVSGKI